MTTQARSWFLAVVVAILNLGGPNSVPALEPEGDGRALEESGGSSLKGDPLSARGYSVTSGAAPGYVEDRVCESCHTDIYESYQRVSMAQAFHKPRPDRVVEDFETSSFFHHESRRHDGRPQSHDVARTAMLPLFWCIAATVSRL